MKAPTPIELENNFVRLLPISADHAQDFFMIGQDAQIWRYLATQPFKKLADAEDWIDMMLARAEYAVTFSVYDVVSAKLAGSSSYMDVRTAHGGLEIGFTWYGRAFQRTHVNSATKLLMLTHAFEQLGANRVQLQTDARNTGSQDAIARIGAVKEGVLRAHKIYPSGFVRDSAMFSVVKQDWPRVKRRLEDFLE